MSGSGRPPAAVVAPLFDTALRLHEEGQLQRAELLYRDVLRQAPQHAGALNMLGVIGCQTGNAQAGADLIRRAVDLEPGNPDYRNNLGMALLEAHAVEAAIEQFVAAIGARPRFVEAHFNLANAYLRRGQPDAAERHYRKALRVRPDEFEVLNNLGNLLRQRGRAGEAVGLFRRCVARQPDFAPGHLNLALALQAQGDLDGAITALQRALDLDDGSIAAWSALGACLRGRGELEAAEQAYERAIERGGASVERYDALGMIRFADGRIDAAAAAFEQALALDAEAPATLDHLGMIEAARGQRAAAQAYFERALLSAPSHGDAWRNLSELCREPAAASNLAARIERVLADLGADHRQRSVLEFALGKLYDQLDEPERAFTAWCRANAQRSRASHFDPDAQARFVAALIEVFDAAWFAASAGLGDASEVPVFIVGMPRSGTTLVEQIVAAHRGVHGAGELTFFPARVAALPRRLGVSEPFPYCVRGHAPELAALAPAYLEVLARRGGGAERVTDKMPYNFLYLGLIATLFPQARVIHCRRDPMATCLSIFAHDLTGSHPYAYDFAHLASAYAGYVQLMAHWRDHLPLRLHEIDYESLIADFEPHARGLVDFLGLAWDGACLDFHRSRRTVTTASQWQVREPLYTSAGTHWQRYARQLEPLRAALGAAGVAPAASRAAN